MSAFTSVRIDGELLDPTTASIPVSDMGFIRGFGVFEVARGHDGACFRLQPHLDRLARSAAMLGIDLPPMHELASWCQHAASYHGQSVVRVLVSAGDDMFDGVARVVVTSEAAKPQPTELRLLPVDAPWHSGGADWELLRAKTLSYANNFGAVRAAKLQGFDDAVLLGRTGTILEGSTFIVGWTIEEDGRTVYETPAISLGILDSITRVVAFEAAVEANLEFREVELGLDRLDDAVEFFAISTLRDAISVTSVGERSFPIGPATAALRSAMAAFVSRETARDLELS